MLWSASLETGVAAIDEQHRELFRIVDMLLDTSNQDRIRETLDFLERYVGTHFHDEMQLQLQSGYPRAAQHKQYHDQFVKTLAEMKARYLKEGKTLTLTLDVNKKVVGWLTSHIMGHDKEFSRYYTQRT